MEWPNRRDTSSILAPGWPRALLLGVEDAADALGIGRTKTYELIATGELEVVHIGRCCRVPTDALEAYEARLRGIPGPADSLRSRPTRPAPENRA